MDLFLVPTNSVWQRLQEILDEMIDMQQHDMLFLDLSTQKDIIMASKIQGRIEALRHFKDPQVLNQANHTL
jgi:hypothetical protein